MLFSRLDGKEAIDPGEPLDNDITICRGELKDVPRCRISGDSLKALEADHDFCKGRWFSPHDERWITYSAARIQPLRCAHPLDFGSTRYLTIVVSSRASLHLREPAVYGDLKL